MCMCTWGVSNHWIGIRTGMEWNGTIWNSKIAKYKFFSYSSNALQEAILHHITGC